MRKYIASLFMTLGLVSTLNASWLDSGNKTSVDDEFTKMNSFINHMMDQQFFKDKFSNFNISSYPKVNMEELEDKYLLKFELAGIKKDEIKLSINNNNILSIQGERKSSQEDKGNDYVRQEVFFGKFQRMIQLPDNIIANKIQSKYNDGILTVTVPKDKTKEKNNLKLIPIQ